MEIIKDFKQTELGVIPSDWDIFPIKNLCVIKTGSKNTQDKVEDGNFPFFVRSQSIEKINSFSYEGEAVLTAGDGVGTGKVFHYINGKFDFHQRVYMMSRFSRNLDGYYFYLYFSNYFFNRISQMTAKSSVDSIRMEMIADMLIPLPPIREQNVISKTLSDADSYINNLQKLIDKKRQIKQGVMQELLKPKDGWKIMQLSDFLMYEQPTNYIVRSTEYNDNNSIPVLTAGKTFILGYTEEDFGVFDKCPVIIFDDFTTATKYVDFKFKVKSSAMKILLPRNCEVDLRFIFELMQNIVYPMGVGDHKRHWISSYQHLEIKVPSIVEQNRISSILTDLENEISTLNKKLNKLIQVKHGLMQSLLTGKIRLI